METIGSPEVNSAYDRRVAFPTELGNSTSTRLHGTSPTILIPVGSTEQHGPHLPLDTDTRIATAVARAAVEQLCRPAGDEDRYLLAPPIAYGASGEHEGFAGTVSIGTAALTAVLVEYGRSACSWAARLVFVNGHGGNVEALRAAVGRAAVRGPRRGLVLLRRRGWRCTPDTPKPQCCCMFRPMTCAPRTGAGATRSRWPACLPQLRHGGVAAVSEVGVLGDPTTATREDGARILAAMVADCARLVERWSPGADGMLT